MSAFQKLIHLINEHQVVQVTLEQVPASENLEEVLIDKARIYMRNTDTLDQILQRLAGFKLNTMQVSATDMAGNSLDIDVHDLKEVKSSLKQISERALKALLHQKVCNLHLSVDDSPADYSSYGVDNVIFPVTLRENQFKRVKDGQEVIIVEQPSDPLKGYTCGDQIWLRPDSGRFDIEHRTVLNFEFLQIGNKRYVMLFFRRLTMRDLDLLRDITNELKDLA